MRPPTMRRDSRHLECVTPAALSLDDVLDATGRIDAGARRMECRLESQGEIALAREALAQVARRVAPAFLVGAHEYGQVHGLIAPRIAQGRGGGEDRDDAALDVADARPAEHVALARQAAE